MVSQLHGQPQQTPLNELYRDEMIYVMCDNLQDCKKQAPCSMGRQEAGSLFCFVSKFGHQSQQYLKLRKLNYELTFP